MDKFFVYFILIFLFSRCIGDIEELPYSPYDDPEFELITITNYTNGGGTFSASFTSNVERINDVAIFRNDVFWRRITNSNQSHFTISNFFPASSTCFTLAFVNGSGDFSRKGNIVCVE